MVDRIYDLYEILKPIADLIEKNKKRIDLIVSEIEDDTSIPDESWDEISELSTSIMNLSYSGGHTPMNSLKKMAVLITSEQEE